MVNRSTVDGEDGGQRRLRTAVAERPTVDGVGDGGRGQSRHTISDVRDEGRRANHHTVTDAGQAGSRQAVRTGRRADNGGAVSCAFRTGEQLERRRDVRDVGRAATRHVPF
jgi:hypothetical protein